MITSVVNMHDQRFSKYNLQAPTQVLPFLRMQLQCELHFHDFLDVHATFEKCAFSTNISVLILSYSNVNSAITILTQYTCLFTVFDLGWKLCAYTLCRFEF